MLHQGVSFHRTLDVTDAREMHQLMRAAGPPLGPAPAQHLQDKAVLKLETVSHARKR